MQHTAAWLREPLNWQRTDGLAKLKSLENLEISHSGIRSFEPIKELTKLRWLSLQVCHSLENLDGIEVLQNLHCLHLVETHKIASPGLHQAANAAVALAVVGELRRQGWAVSEGAVRDGLAAGVGGS